MLKIKKILIYLLITLVVLVNSPVGFAAELPSSPEVPELPENSQTVTASPAPEVPSTAETPVLPENSPSNEPITETIPTPGSDNVSVSEEQPSGASNETPTDPALTSPSTESLALGDTTQNNKLTQETGGQENNNAVGDPQITTGTAEINGVVANSGNTNINTSNPAGPSASVTNDGNGSDSQNSGAINQDNNTTTDQDNSATITNNLNLEGVSGDNTASRNVGTSSITSGDSNVTGTIVNNVNTNIDGVAVAEFNIADDYIGDFVLDFAAGCISGCSSPGGASSISNTDNGSDSENSGEINTSNTSETFQNNDANVINELILAADTGNNNTDNNTKGDNTITTGDANVSGNILNFVNNNLAGGVVYTVVNIFGDLVGDIIMPVGYLQDTLALISGASSITNSENGSGSTNTGTIDSASTSTTTQTNTATINNNVDLEATTGSNKTSDNTGGANSITTGDTDVDANILNIANNNIIGGDWWIVLVNEAGNWVGKILGLPSGSPDGSLAASEGTGFTFNPDGSISITNDGNSSDSQNSGEVTSINDSTVVQENNALINNNVKLSANTGGNSASRNTGGDNSITTGDANVMLNLVNFVNNNFSGGRVFLTVVNVLGSWTGDFLSPGAKKETKQENNNDTVSPLADAANPNPDNSNNNHNNSGNHNSGSDTNSVSNNNSSNTQTSSTSSTNDSGGGTVTGGFGGGLTFASTNNHEEEEPLVAGVSNINNGKKSVTKSDDGKIKINLAWTLLALPFAGAMLLGRRIKRARTFEIRRLEA